MVNLPKATNKYTMYGPPYIVYFFVAFGRLTVSNSVKKEKFIVRIKFETITDASSHIKNKLAGIGWSILNKK